MYYAGMGKSVAEVTGIETIKTLVASLAMPDFTVDELARQADVSRRTVDTILRRYKQAFEKMSAPRHTGRGRPPVRWRLRPEHLDAVVAAVKSHQSALSKAGQAIGSSTPSSDRAEASMIMAAVAISRTSDDAEELAQLVVAARYSLAAAGFSADGLPLSGQPSQELAGKALLVAAVTDVVDACASNDQERIDEAQARAMPRVIEATEYLAASEWLPLAQRVVLAPGTVLSAPVLVGKDSVGYFNQLFPNLEAIATQDDVPAGFVRMSDTRVEPSLKSGPATFLLRSQSPACVVVSNQPDIPRPFTAAGALPVLPHGVPGFYGTATADALPVPGIFAGHAIGIAAAHAVTGIAAAHAVTGIAAAHAVTGIAHAVNWHACGLALPGSSGLSNFGGGATFVVGESAAFVANSPLDITSQTKSS
jgi:hypothetical protein